MVNYLEMGTRIKFSTNPRIVLGNRLPLPNENTPSIMALQVFFVEFIECLFTIPNSTQKHICTDFCNQDLQVMIGNDDTPAKDLVSR